ncbi:MAG: right-handed parallel beta-helix repeat-containing protein [Candidatus Cloacimonadaceae bacterium]
MKIKNLSRTIFLKPGSYILISIIVLIFAFLCNSCSTNADKGTISGIVMLVNDSDNPSLNPVDYAGVTVALYKTAVLDTTLVRINQQYPQIGVQITQETEFDHRNFNPLKVVSTDAEGKFSFPSLSAGNYNLVLWKTDWGIRYLCSVRAEEKENNNLGTIELYPATSYDSPLVNEPTIFKSDHSYFVLTDVNFMSSVEFQPRTQIFINPACMVKFYGAVTTPEFTSSRDMWKITTGKEIYSTSPVTMDMDSYYSAVNFYGDEINLRTGIVRYGSNGISTLNIDSNSVNYMVFKDCNDALTISHGDLGIRNIVVTNSKISGITYSSNIGEGGILSIEKCILNNIAERGIYILWSNYYHITNIYFNNINFAIYIRGSNGLTYNNIFDNNYYYIYFYKDCTYNEVTYNNFYKTSMGLYLIGNINNINNNNFYGPIKYYIMDITKNISPYSSVSADVNATNNYWLVDDISQYLADAEDDPRCPYHILYLPKLSNPVREAGIN